MATNIGKLSVVLSAVTAPFTAKMRKATGSITAMAKASRIATAAVGAMTVGLAAASAAAVKSSVAFAKFEFSMSRVKALSSATGDEFARLKSLARDLGSTTQFTATQAAEAMQFFALAGFETNEILQSMRPTLALAAAGQLQISEAADIAAKTMAGMGLEADDLGGVVDVLAKAMTTANTDLLQLGEALGVVGPLGRAIGKDIEELTASIQVMSDAGIQGEKAGTALRNIFIRMTEKGGIAANKLREVGVAVADADGKVRNLSSIIGDLADATSGMTDIQKASTLSTIGGARAVAALSVLVAKGGKEIGKMEDALRDAGGTAQNIADVQLDNLHGSVIRLQSAVEGLMITLGDGESGIARSSVDWLADLTNQIDELIQSAEGGTLTIRAIGDELLVALGAIGVISKGAGFSFLDGAISEADRLANQVGLIEDGVEAIRQRMEKTRKEREAMARAVRLEGIAAANEAREGEGRAAGAFSGRVNLLKSLGFDVEGLRRENGEIKGQLDKLDAFGGFIGRLQSLKRDATDPVTSLTKSLMGSVFSDKNGAVSQTDTYQKSAGALQRGSTAEFSARIAALGGGKEDRTAKATEKNTDETAKNTRQMADLLRDFSLSQSQAATVVSI